MDGYPDNNPKTMQGAKKPGIMGVPARAIYGIGRAFRDGIEKYGLYNWREKKVSSSVYFEAAQRHLWLWWDGEEFSADTVARGRPVHHLEHVMACCAIILDGQDVGNLNDDRGIKGGLSKWLEEWTQKDPEAIDKLPKIEPRFVSRADEEEHRREHPETPNPKMLATLRQSCSPKIRSGE